MKTGELKGKMSDELVPIKEYVKTYFLLVVIGSLICLALHGNALAWVVIYVQSAAVLLGNWLACRKKWRQEIEAMFRDEQSLCTGESK